MLVECLTCSGNQIGNEGAIAIAESLKVNNSLQHINHEGEASWLSVSLVQGMRLEMKEPLQLQSYSK